MDETEEVPFRGFAELEDNDVREKLKGKLAYINNAVAVAVLGGERIRVRTPSASSVTSATSTSSNLSSPRRPINRFLRRSESLTSPPPPNTPDPIVPKQTRPMSWKSVQPECDLVEKRKSTPGLFLGSLTSTRSRSMSSPSPVEAPAIANSTSNGLVKISSPEEKNPPIPVPILKDTVPKQNLTPSRGEKPKRVNKFLNCPPTTTRSNMLTGLFANAVKVREQVTTVANATTSANSNGSISNDQTGILNKTKPSRVRRASQLNSAVEVEPPKAVQPEPATEEPEDKSTEELQIPLVSPDLSLAPSDNKTFETVAAAIVLGKAPPPALLESVPKVIIVEEKTPDAPNLVETEKIENKKPSHSKKAASISEMSFLSGQSSRSKRTIVPNKKFFSEDSDLPKGTATNIRQEVKAKVHLSPGKVASTSRKSFTAVSVAILSSSEKEGKIKATTSAKLKKRSVSEDNPKKRKLSASSESVAVAVPVPPVVPSEAARSEKSNDTNSTVVEPTRPRRTIIPNRKFISENEVVTVKETKARKSNEATEPQRKRRKSEKYAQFHTNTSPKVELTPEKPISSVCDVPKSKPGSEVKQDKKHSPNGANSYPGNYVAKPVVSATTRHVKIISSSPITKSVHLSPPATAKLPQPPIVNGNCANVNAVKKSPEKISPDELPLPDVEVKLIEGDPKFVGACILKTADHPVKTMEKLNVGIVCCGVCSRLKKYRAVNEKRIQGSYLCVECIDVVNKVFQSALQSRPFSCIRGPPVCEGACPLVFQPCDQFCEACFAKTCLRNLPMKADIYFKIWRSIPPMSRGCVPYSPVVNKASPNVGNVIYINDHGEISSVERLEIEEEVNGPDAPSSNGDSKKESKAELRTDDLNSARISSFTHHRNDSSGKNCENTVPIPTLKCIGSTTESLASAADLQIANNSDSVKSNGVAVAQEEILLGRQIGQERVKAMIDPILKPDPEDIETHGFPVVVCGSAYPRLDMNTTLRVLAWHDVVESPNNCTPTRRRQFVSIIWRLFSVASWKIKFGAYNYRNVALENGESVHAIIERKYYSEGNYNGVPLYCGYKTLGIRTDPSITNAAIHNANWFLDLELIFCSMCCEPYHPYCAGDDLLLDTYISHYSSTANKNYFGGNESDRDQNQDGDSMLEVELEENQVTTNSKALTSSNNDASQIVLKWNCRRCISCKGCGQSIGGKEMIRCVKCRDTFHMESCIDKLFLGKNKDHSKLKKIWTCDGCISCKSCGKKFPETQRIKAIKQIVASTVEGEEEEEGNEGEDEEGKSNSYPLLCQPCFKQREKGSFCPFCEVCYQDDDWDCKMMECSKCNRWIHASCENLNDDLYYILGRLPENIEYVCRLCHTQPGSPLWSEAIQSQLIKECNTALRLLEKKVLGIPVRKRESVDLEVVKPSFVRNLFAEENFSISLEEGKQEEDKVVEEGLTEKVVEEGLTEKVVEEGLAEKGGMDKSLELETESESENMSRRLRQSVRKKPVSCKVLMTCKVNIRDFIRHPTTLEENWYALKSLGVEILNESYMEEGTPIEEERLPTTPVHKTPSRKLLYTPKRHVLSLTNLMKGKIKRVTSLKSFQKMLLKEIYILCETEKERNFLVEQSRLAIKETFSWMKSVENVEDLLTPEILEEEDEMEELPQMEGSDPQQHLAIDPFKEVYWDPTDFFDDRSCSLCGEKGDFPPDQCGRLLWCGVNEWIHCNCAIWSSEVYELDSGALQDVATALHRGKSSRCKVCKGRGATVSCCQNTCKNSYHFLCSFQANCNLLENKRIYCAHHPLTNVEKEMIQDDMKIGRKVFVDLSAKQKKSILVDSDNVRVFIGSLRINRLGVIVPISVVQKDNDPTSFKDKILIPKQFQVERLFWSLENPCQKESYLFETGSSFDEHSERTKFTQDPGVNLTVSHENEARALKGLENINRYHRWLRHTPKFFDEHYIDWVTPCTEEFIVEEENVIVEVEMEQEQPNELFEPLQLQPQLSNFCGRTSPSSTISMCSFSSSTSNCRVRRSYDFRRLPGRTNPESVTSDGYASSIDSVSLDLEESTISARILKRRRSSSGKTLGRSKENTLKPKGILKAKPKFESPRRRSLRNLSQRERDRLLIESMNSNAKNLKNPGELEGQIVDKGESDADSGIGIFDNASSTNGSCERENLRCRVNLLTQLNFETGSEAGTSASTEMEIVTPVEEFFGTDAVATSTPVDDKLPNFESETESKDKQEAEATHITEDPEPIIHEAAINVQIKRNKDQVCYQTCDVKSAWMFLFEELSKKRIEWRMKPLVQPTLHGIIEEDELRKAQNESCLRMLGLSQRSVVYLLEQLPDMKQVARHYVFQYAARPHLDPIQEDYPLSLNSTGSARSDGFKGRKPFDMFGWLASRHRKVPQGCVAGEESKRGQGLPPAMRYRELVEKSKERFVVAHSDIHGRGLFTRCDLEKGDMLIEYAGEVIRPSLSDPRERYYESRGIGCYMFRIKTQVIDATLKGNAARFINHSCEPNCEAKTMRILGKDHIIIYTIRKILKGEELTYDYKFEREENKIPCSCGAVRCRRYMN